MPYRPKQHRPKEIEPLHGQRRPSASQRGYGVHWRWLRRCMLRDHPLCADPFGLHASDDYGLVPAQHVDHIIPLADGGTNDESNLQCLCAPCHGRKTVFHDGGFGRPRHPLRRANESGVDDKSEREGT